MKRTENLDLPIFESADRPTWLVDVNDAMRKIDTGFHGVSEDSTQALAVAKDAKEQSQSAEESATTAVETANSADTKAADAVNNATAAGTKSDTALNKATEAYDTAGAAVQTANAAKTAADKASADVSTAISDSAEAKEKADAATATANSAAQTAQTAHTDAEAAKTTAEAAKKTADGLDAKITAANNNASNAVATATEAKNTAETAKNTADGAKSTANTAIATANSRIGVLYIDLHVSKTDTWSTLFTNAISTMSSRTDFETVNDITIQIQVSDSSFHYLLRSKVMQYLKDNEGNDFLAIMMLHGNAVDDVTADIDFIYGNGAHVKRTRISEDVISTDVITNAKLLQFAPGTNTSQVGAGIIWNNQGVLS